MHFDGLMELYCLVEVVIRIGTLENQIIIYRKMKIASQWVWDLNLLQATKGITDGTIFLVTLGVLDLSVKEIEMVRNEYCMLLKQERVISFFVISPNA